MRHRSLTNSRKYENLPLRYAYEEANPMDEITHLFPARGRGESVVQLGSQKVIISRWDQHATDTHHIAKGTLGCDRWDETTNLIRCYRTTHDFCEKYKADGFVICATAKIAKGEWDWQRMAEIMGIKSVMGWLEQKELNFPFTRELFKRLLREAA